MAGKTIAEARTTIAEKTRAERIRRMERYLDRTEKAVDKMSKALKDYEAVQGDFKRLTDYYLGGKWMEDHDADERGELPAGLKRGVLSEDAVYDLLTRHHDMTARLLKIIAKNLEENRA